MLLESVDAIQLDFTKDSLFLMNVLLGFIMFGVALEIKLEHFRDLIKDPVSPAIGVISQFVLLPALTFGLILLLKPSPSLALGMILVAACPGGNISNFMSNFAKGNAALSVGLTAIATALAIIMTPFNFSFYASRIPEAQALLADLNVSLDFLDMFKTILMILAVPLVLGMLFANYLPKITDKIVKPIKYLSFAIFLGFVAIAFTKNTEIFTKWIHAVILLVFLHNTIALSLGYFLAKVLGRPEADCRTLSIETGIQNSGLGLILIFSFFNGLGGMALVAGWWGIWHILSGLTLATIWSRKAKK